MFQMTQFLLRPPTSPVCLSARFKCVSPDSAPDQNLTTCMGSVPPRKVARACLDYSDKLFNKWYFFTLCPL